MTTPCLLFNTDQKPTELRVVSERYYPLTLGISDPPSGLTFYVKKRSAHLSYRQDPYSHRSLSIQTGSSGGGSFIQLVSSFTEEPKVLAFAKYLCETENGSTTVRSSGPFSVAGFCTRVLHECLRNDTEEALPLYLTLRSSVDGLINSDSSATIRFVWDFRLIRTYYQRRRHLQTNCTPKLLNDELFSYLCELLESALLAEPDGESSTSSHPRLGPISVFYGLPLIR